MIPSGTDVQTGKGSRVRLLLALTAWLTLCSVVSFVQYGVDKSRAGKAKRRIPEKTLLLTALAGGWPGAVLGSRTFRHKTQKQPYRRLFALAVAGKLGLMAFACWILWPVLVDDAS